MPSAASVNVAGRVGDVSQGYLNELGNLTGEFFYRNRYIKFSTGSSGTVSININIGSQSNPVSGKISLTGFRLVPLYYNTFSQQEDLATWLFVDETSKWTYEKGELSYEEGEGIKAFIRNQRCKNLSVESDITVSNGTSYSDAGIMFRANNIGEGPNSFKGYYVGIDAFNKVVKLGKFNNDYKHLKSHAVNIIPNKKYHIKVEAIENVIKVYVDNMNFPVLTYTDTEPDSSQYVVEGFVGVRNYLTHTHFDNFEIGGASTLLY